jgi:hypothetical protein
VMLVAHEVGAKISGRRADRSCLLMDAFGGPPRVTPMA